MGPQVALPSPLAFPRILAGVCSGRRTIIGAMQELSDEELVARFRADSGSARARASIDELFGRYHQRVAAWCFRFTGDAQSAGDLAQDIFLRAYRNLDSFRGEAKFSTWLFTVSRNHCVNEMKARSARPEEPADLQET